MDSHPLIILFFFSPFRHILPGRTQSPRPGHDPRPPRGVHWGGGRQSGGHTRIRSYPLTTLCPVLDDNPAALSGTVSLQAGCTAVAELLRGADIFHGGFQSATSPPRMQIQNSCVNTLDLAIPSMLEDVSICSDVCACEKCGQTAARWMCVCVCVCTVNVFVTWCFKMYGCIWDCVKCWQKWRESWLKLPLLCRLISRWYT